METIDKSVSRSQRTKGNLKNLALWTAAWLVTMAIATFGSILIWDGNTLVSVILIILNMLTGIGMIMANIRHLKGQDELDQKITMDAMAIALGVGIVGGLSYSLMDITDVITRDAEISFMVVLISITYLIAIVVGKLRYR